MGGAALADAAAGLQPSSLPPGFPRRDLILELVASLAEDPRIERVWLFGSRARGDGFERSDIDLAIAAPDLPKDDWIRLHLDFPEEAPTLLLIDLVRLERAPADLREEIEAEGILLYERAGARQA